MANVRRVQDIREANGWTQEQLAARTHGIITLATISRIEREVVSPNPATRKVLADALGVGMDAVDWPGPKRDKS